MKKSFVVIALLLVASLPAFSQIEYARAMANTIMKTYQDSMVVKKYASHLEQDNLIQPGQTAEQAQADRPANWNYEIGVVLMGFERLYDFTKDSAYYNYMKHIIDHFITDDGGIRTYTMEEFNSDNVPPGRQLLRLYNDTRETKYKLAAAVLDTQVHWQPRNRSGGFWHKLKYPYQMWLDGLYMIEPFYAMNAQAQNRKSEFDDIALQFLTMFNHSYDKRTGLLYHGWDESKLQRWADPVTGTSPEFWSRAMGWYLMALVDVLEYMPKDHPRRDELVGIYKTVVTALVKYQDIPSGVWWQVTDKANQPGNYLESSSTAMFVFAMAKGIRLNYLPTTYKYAVTKAWSGMLRQFLTQDASGTYHFNQAVAGAGLGGVPYRDGSYNYYVNEPKRNDDLKAIGPFMQACIEMDRLLHKQPD